LDQLFCMVVGGCQPPTQQTNSGGNNGGTPKQKPAPKPKPKQVKGSSHCGIQRVRLVAQAFVNFQLASAKLGEAALAGVAAPETGGATIPGVLYGFWGGSGNIAAAGIQLTGAVTGKIRLADEAASTATTLTTAGGVVGIFREKGNLEAASVYAGVESLFSTGVKGGLSGRLFEKGLQGLLDATETGQTIADMLGLNGTCDEE